MRNDVKTFEEELNLIIEICDEKIKRYRALLEEYQMIKGSALSLLNMNNNTKRKVVSLIDALKQLKYGLYALMESENALKEAIRRLKGEESKNNPNFGGLVLRPGFEPGSPARKAGILDRSILPEQSFTIIFMRLFLVFCLSY
jgi:hypothetical protein